MHSSQSDPKGVEAEISLIDIVNFLQDVWKKLAVASMAGAVIGLGIWFVFGTYSAEYVLLNNNNNSHALDLVSWKMLQKNLPNLADQIIDENKVPENQSSIYRVMSSEQWWQKNVTPSYALSKADTKELASISKDMTEASSMILSFTLGASGRSKEQAMENVRVASQFMRSGSAYLQLRALLRAYETQLLSTAADLDQKITATQVEIAYQQDRIGKLEDLRKRFTSPSSGTMVSQQVDTGNSGGKYLPLTTQIIAANTDLNQSKEDIARLQDRLQQIGVSKVFLDQALPLQDRILDGLELVKSLLEIELSMRAKLDTNDKSGAQFLSGLRAQLLAIQVRFTKGLEANTAPTSSGKKGMIKSAVSGLAAAFFLMLLVLWGQRVWQTEKSSDTK